MISMLDETYAGLDCLKLENGLVNLYITKDVGPRILGFGHKGKQSLFAVLPDEKIDYPGGDALYLRGGHRLWYAPERSITTYIPDNRPVNIELMDDGVQITQPTDELTAIQKSMVVRLSSDQPVATIEHRLVNTGEVPVHLAPWAITQLQPGGVAILPQTVGNSDPEGLLPNRQIALWPYTKINSPHIKLGDRYLYVLSQVEEGALKVGFPNPRGWLGYHLRDTLFIKKAAFYSDEHYYDRGSSSECYCNPKFLELETLGPKTILEPKRDVCHVEEWVVFDDFTFSLDEDRKINFFDNL